MAWGIFNKIATGARRAYDFAKNTVVPFTKAAVDISKPFLKGTKMGKFVDGADSFTKKFDDIDRRVSSYKKARTLKPEFDLDDDADDNDDDDY